MPVLDDAIADHAHRFGDRLHVPEYRQIELYTKKKKLVFADPPPRNEPIPSLLGVANAFMLLDGFFEAADETLDGKSTWQRYLALPRTTPTDKMVAEVYRVLRILRIVLVHKSGRLELNEGIIVARATFNRCALAVHTTVAGLMLLESFVARFLDLQSQPYGEAYVEALLSQYFSDIIGEIKRFADEDRILYQYRHRFYFNRHFRYDCDNPKHRLDDGKLVFEIGPLYADPVRYPIDFFVVVDEVLCIIPVEALSNNAIALAELPRWRARTAEGAALPAHFRARFGRETMTPGLPMW